MLRWTAVLPRPIAAHSGADDGLAAVDRGRPCTMHAPIYTNNYVFFGVHEVS